MKHDVPGFEETNTIDGQALSSMLGAAHYWKNKHDNVSDKLKSLKAPSRKLILFVFILGISTGIFISLIAKGSLTLSIWTAPGFQYFDDNRASFTMLKEKLSISPMLYRV